MATSTLSVIFAVVLAAAVVFVGWWSARHAHPEGTGSDEPLRIDGDIVVRCALVAVVGAIGLLVVAIMVFGFDAWDAMSVLYLDVVLALPLIGAAFLLGGRVGTGGPLFRLTKPVTVLSVLALFAAPLGYYMTHVEPYRLQTDLVAVDLSVDRAGSDAVRVGVISDIQTVAVTDHERAAVERLVDLEPDIILIAGDIFQGTRSQFDEHRAALRALFELMEAPGGAFLVAGDVDAPAVLEELVAGTPVELLVNEVARSTVGDREIAVGGVELERSDAGSAIIDELESLPAEEIAILLSHRPDWALELAPDSRVDLAVAGHTHGGQVQLPFVGPLITMSEVPRAVAAGGLHDLAGNQVYVTPGIGREQQGAPQIRFLAPPEVALLTLAS